MFSFNNTTKNNKKNNKNATANSSATPLNGSSGTPNTNASLNTGTSFLNMLKTPKTNNNLNATPNTNNSLNSTPKTNNSLNARPKTNNVATSNNMLTNTLLKTLSAQKNDMEENFINLGNANNVSTPASNMNRNKTAKANTNTHRYDVPMFDLKHWYEHEMEAVGHLAAMRDEYLRRMYASKTVNGMNHLVRAIQEKIDSEQYTNEKKYELGLMKDNVEAAKEHLKSDYDVTEENITYKWNVSGGGKKKRAHRRRHTRRRVHHRK
jgi:hypothetical protein